MTEATPLLGTSKATQVALLVHDIKKTAAAWAKFLGQDMPQIIVTGDLSETNATYNGEPSPAKAQLAFFDLGDGLQLELIQPDDQPSVWRDYLNEHGEGFHHLAFNVKDTIKRGAEAAAAGYPTVATGDYEGGCYSYLDANDELKVFVETLENF